MAAPDQCLDAINAPRIDMTEKPINKWCQAGIFKL
jgi:hypothetical protein